MIGRSRQGVGSARANDIGDRKKGTPR